MLKNNLKIKIKIIFIIIKLFNSIKFLNLKLD